MAKKIEPAMIIEMPTHGEHSQPRIDLTRARAVRAGSDYLQFAWSINLNGMSYDVGATYKFYKGSEFLYEATAVRYERLDGKVTTLFVEPEYANMFM